MNQEEMTVEQLTALFQKPDSPWGLSTCINLYECDKDLIKSKEKIKEFTIHLCDLLEVKRFGEPVIVHFGRDDRVEGYSLVQLIETSLVSGHFAEYNNSVYIDVFSCKFYNPGLAFDYCGTFFNAKRATYKTVVRD
jgi:S-adenosylmethionine/arginine decarboxylase-like enzyme